MTSTPSLHAATLPKIVRASKEHVSDQDQERWQRILSRHPWLADHPNYKALAEMLAYQSLEATEHFLHDMLWATDEQIRALFDEAELPALYVPIVPDELADNAVATAQGGATAKVGELRAGRDDEIKALMRVRAIAQGMEFLRGCPELNTVRLDQFNRRYAFVRDYGSRARVVMWDQEGRPLPMPTTDWAKGYNNERVLQWVPKGKKGDGPVEYKAVETKLGDWWLAHPDRRTYQSTAFYPGKPRDLPGDTLNLWAGWPLAGPLQKGDKELLWMFLDYLQDVVCGGVEEEYTWLLYWMANAVQNPHKPGCSAVVLAHGDEGVGKTFFGEMFGLLFGPHYLPVSHSKHVTGNFNAHLRTTVLLNADEALFAGNLEQADQLKNLLTGTQLLVEPKGADAFPSRNCTHVIICSNHAQPVAASASSRRFFVPSFSPHRMRDKEYFGDIARCMEAGGARALFHWLMEMQIPSDWAADNPPVTERLEQVRAATDHNPTVEMLVDAEPMLGGDGPLIVTAASVLRLLGREDQRGRLVSDVKAAMVALGFKNKKVTINGTTFACYVRGDQASARVLVVPQDTSWDATTGSYRRFCTLQDRGE